MAASFEQTSQVSEAQGLAADPSTDERRKLIRRALLRYRKRTRLAGPSSADRVCKPDRATHYTPHKSLI
jgi:hypothetical protein